MKWKLRYRALIATLAVNAFAIAVEVAARPLHERGVMQSVLGYANALGDMLQFPGLGLYTRTGGSFSYRMGPAARGMMLAWNLVFWFVASSAMFRLLGARRSKADGRPHAAKSPSDDGGARAAAATEPTY